MKFQCSHHRFAAFWCLALVVTVIGSMACGNSTPTEPLNGPGPIIPPGPQGDGIVGSGVFVEEDRPMSGFSGVRLLSVASVFIEQGGRESLMLRAEDNVISHVLTEVVGGTLEISTAAGVSFDDIGPIQAFVTVSSLSSIDLDGVGDIQAMGVSFSELDLRLSGTGSMDLEELDGERLAVRMDGVGRIAIGGRVVEQTVELFGVGDYRAKRLHSERAEVTIHSLGSATVRVSDYLRATVRGSGSIFYYGNPTVESDISGSGSVEQMGG
jgi:hypothetical protein